VTFQYDEVIERRNLMKRRMDITLRLSFVKRVIEEIMEELAQFKGRSSKQRILLNEKIGSNDHRKDK
jgi:hypothetical protein